MTAAAVALLLAGALAPAADAATSGFGRPASSPTSAPARPSTPTSPPASAPRAPSPWANPPASAARAPAADPAPVAQTPSAPAGFGRPAASVAAPANRPTGTSDTAINGAVSKDAYDQYKARQAPPAPANDAPKATASTPAGGFVPQGSGYVPPPAAPYVPPAPRTVVIHHDYGYQSNPADFTNGLLVGTLLGQLGNRHSDGYYDNDEARRHLRDIAANTSDPDIRRRIDDRLGPTVANPVNVNASVAASAAPASGGHGFLWALLVIAVLAGAGLFFYLRRRPAGVVPGRTVDRVEPLAATVPVARVEDNVMGMRFRPGGYVEIPEEDVILAGANGSDVPEALSGRHSIEAVGRYVQRGHTFERAYFDGGKAFLEKVSSNDNAKAQVRLYRLADEQTPDADEWAFFLGGKGADGVEREAYIGVSSVKLPPKEHDWFRVWGAGDAAVKPEQVTERVEGRGQGSRSHSLMQYFRETGKDTEGQPAFEYAYLGRVDDGNTAVIRTWVGIDIPGDAAKAA